MSTLTCKRSLHQSIEPLSEKKIKAQILDWLDKSGIEAWNNPRGHGRLKWGGYIVYGGRPGASDIIGYLPDGRFLAIETKVEDKSSKASEDQIAFIDKLNSAGGVGLVARKVEEVVEAITPLLKR